MSKYHDYPQHPTTSLHSFDELGRSPPTKRRKSENSSKSNGIGLMKNGKLEASSTGNSNVKSKELVKSEEVITPIENKNTKQSGAVTSFNAGQIHQTTKSEPVTPPLTSKVGQSGKSETAAFPLAAKSVQSEKSVLTNVPSLPGTYRFMLNGRWVTTTIPHASNVAQSGKSDVLTLLSASKGVQSGKLTTSVVPVTSKVLQGGKSEKGLTQVASKVIQGGKFETTSTLGVAKSGKAEILTNISAEKVQQGEAIAKLIINKINAARMQETGHSGSLNISNTTNMLQRGGSQVVAKSIVAKLQQNGAMEKIRDRLLTYYQRRASGGTSLADTNTKKLTVNEVRYVKSLICRPSYKGHIALNMSVSRFVGRFMGL